MGEARRIVSLLPSATEIVCALGLQDRLVGVTHECDFPPDVARLPHLTSSIIPGDALSGREIDAAVRDSLAEQASIYRLDHELLGLLGPDLVITQAVCAVCAVGPDEVQPAVAALPHQPQVL